MTASSTGHEGDPAATATQEWWGAEDVCVRYGEKLAVDDLDFVVQPGTVTGFLGPNGAGKSTTMRMIAGLDEPTAGRVLVNGTDYRAASDR